MVDSYTSHAEQAMREKIEAFSIPLEHQSNVLMSLYVAAQAASNQEAARQLLDHVLDSARDVEVMMHDQYPSICKIAQKMREGTGRG